MLAAIGYPVGTVWIPVGRMWAAVGQHVDPWGHHRGSVDAHLHDLGTSRNPKGSKEVIRGDAVTARGRTRPAPVTPGVGRMELKHNEN